MPDRMQWSLPLVESLAGRGSSTMMNLPIPSDIWNQFGQYLDNPADIKGLRESSVSGFNSAAMARSAKLSASMNHFSLLEFTVPPALLDKAFEIHPIVPDGRGAIMLVDESENPGRGVEIVWMEGEVRRQTALGFPGNEALTPKKVSNVRFSPCGNYLALLSTMGRMINDSKEESLSRSPRIPEKTQVDPVGDSTVVIVKLSRNLDKSPRQIIPCLYTETFVPEYGFDLIWRTSGATPVPELVFVALVHSPLGAEALLVRFRPLRGASPIGRKLFFADDGISLLFQKDKLNAMQQLASTHVTSRVELSDDGQWLFFDTASMCAVMSLTRDIPEAHNSVFRMNPDRNFALNDEDFWKASRIAVPQALNWNDFPNILRMSPDGSLVCVLVSLPPKSPGDRPIQVLNTVAVPSKVPIFRRVLKLEFSTPFWQSEMFDKNSNLANQVMGYSKDSTLLWLRSCVITPTECRIDYGCLPAIIDARSGRLLQDFGRASPYHFVHVAPCALIVYGKRRREGWYVEDAIDVMSGKVMKTVRCAHRSKPSMTPDRLSGPSVFRTAWDTVTIVANGDLDLLWKMTHGSIGIQWTRSGSPLQN